ncbi:MAG: ATP-dependent zinc protease family protein [Phycisphaerales bacterium]
MNQVIIGWRERVALPDWGISKIRVKADTGARSSAIDVDEFEELPGDRVRFTVVTSRRSGRARVTECEAPILRRAIVKSSMGRVQTRIFVETELELAGIRKRIAVSLVSRHHMISRMLLGRTALAPEFIIDPCSVYLLQQDEEHTPSKTSTRLKRKGHTQP